LSILLIRKNRWVWRQYIREEMDKRGRAILFKKIIWGARYPFWIMEWRNFYRRLIRKGEGIFSCPPWIEKVVIRDDGDPLNIQVSGFQRGTRNRRLLISSISPIFIPAAFICHWMMQVTLSGCSFEVLAVSIIVISADAVLMNLMSGVRSQMSRSQMSEVEIPISASKLPKKNFPIIGFFQTSDISIRFFPHALYIQSWTAAPSPGLR